MSKLEEKLDERELFFNRTLSTKSSNDVCKIISALRKALEQRNEVAKDPNCKQTETYFKAMEELDAEILQILEGE